MFDYLGSFDAYNEDYTPLLEAMNSKDMFRSFGEGLLFFLQKKNVEVTAEKAVGYIKDCCKETGVPEGDIGSINTLKG